MKERNLVPGVESAEIVGHKRETEARSIDIFRRPHIGLIRKRSQILGRDDLL